MKNFTALYVFALLFVFPQAASSQQIHYVKSSASGSGDGSSWANAFDSLQDAIAAAASGDQVWVAAGTYYPDDGASLAAGDRSLAFALKSGVRIHGGFAGSESSKAGRDLLANQTILSGDLEKNDDGLSRYDDNAYHVVRADGTDDSSLLEGVLILGGNANGVDADSLGGGILISGGSPWLINVRVNSSVAGCGGGIAVVDGGAPTLVNIAVNGNRAITGGGICNMDSAPSFVNATITGNTASTGPGVYNIGSDISIENSIVFGNRVLSDADHCAVWQYPCILANVSEASKVRTAELMDGAYALRNTGSMVDVLEYFRSQPDVVQAFGDSVTVAMRIAGGRMSYFMDGSKIFPTGFGKRDGSPTQEVDATTAEILANQLIRGGAMSGLPDYSQAAALIPKAPSVGAKNSIARPHTIVGEDLNGDGIINNRDPKRALIFSPLGLRDGNNAATLMYRAPGYGTGPTFKGPPVQTNDFTLTNWSNWDDYDFIYLSTVARSIFDEEGDVRDTIFMTGIPYSSFTSQPQSAMGQNTAWTWYVNPDDGDTDPLVVLSPAFFRDVYNGQLDNGLLICAWCSMEGDWFWTMGAGETDFGVMGWRSNDEVSLATQQNDVELYNETSLLDLVNGFPVAHAYRQNSPTWEFSEGFYSFGFAGTRITELPVLIFHPFPNENGQIVINGGRTPFVDGSDVTDLIVGTVGDGQPDVLILPVYISGISEENRGDYEMSIFVDGIEVFEATRLDMEQNYGSYQEAAYLFYPFIELGYDLQNGVLPIDVVIERPNFAPDWGQSSYSVLATVGGFSCSASASFRGYRNGSFTGVAGWTGGQFGNDVVVTLNIESAASVMGWVIPSLSFSRADFNLTMILENPVEHFTVPQAKPDSTTFDVSAALTSRYAAEPWFNSYTESATGCPGCEARVRVDSTSADGITWYGEYSFLGKDITSSSVERRLTFVQGKFKAVQGDQVNSTSPYFQCVNEYRELAE